MHGKMKKDSKVKLRAVLEKLAPVEFNQVRYSSSLPCMRKLVGGKCGAPEAAGGNNPVSQPDMSEAETPAAANCNEYWRTTCSTSWTKATGAVNLECHRIEPGLDDDRWRRAKQAWRRQEACTAGGDVLSRGAPARQRETARAGVKLFRPSRKRAAGWGYLEEGTLHRVIGWAHPALLQLLLYLRTTLFVDGTFQCVPVPYHQCVVVMCLDNAANCYVPVFYSLAKGLAHATYWDIFHILIVATDHQLILSRSRVTTKLL
ncbi:hypothetical protein PR001_g5139 [Phytophthora rubi]|uniref:MULE transposase domain-containing protein n=1 Tax=Phytophthora rubi TaxID=129364 RepID=A0A6A3NNI8_9STRA|nr:hypothetical protein PR001_g5139 [Phytophthora rubi]